VEKRFQAALISGQFIKNSGHLVKFRTFQDKL